MNVLEHYNIDIRLPISAVSVIGLGGRGACEASSLLFLEINIIKNVLRDIILSVN